MATPDPRSEVRQCAHPRCRRTVFDVQIIKAKGAPAVEVVDTQPRPWAEGARIKLIPSEHAAPGAQLAEKLTTAQIHKAFGVAHLYVPHVEVCDGAPKRKTAKKEAGHA